MNYTPSDIELLFHEYNQAIFRFILIQVRNRSVATDLTQDVFIKTWDYLQKGKEVKDIKPFLYRVAKNSVIDWSRKKTTDSLDDLLEQGLDPGIHHEEFGKLQDQRKALQKVFSLLSSDEAQLLTMRYIDELSIKDIAAVLKISPNVTSVRIHRIIQKLQKNSKITQHFYYE